MKYKIAKLIYRILRPFIDIEWEQSFVNYGTVFRIKIFNKIVSEVLYSPDMKSLRERWELSK